MRRLKICSSSDIRVDPAYCKKQAKILVDFIKRHQNERLDFAVKKVHRYTLCCSIPSIF